MYNSLTSLKVSEQRRDTKENAATHKTDVIHCSWCHSSLENGSVTVNMWTTSFNGWGRGDWNYVIIDGVFNGGPIGTTSSEMWGSFNRDRLGLRHHKRGPSKGDWLVLEQHHWYDFKLNIVVYMWTQSMYYDWLKYIVDMVSYNNLLIL